MSQRNPDTSFITTLRNIEERLRKLESAQNNAVKRNDIRIGDIRISASDDLGLLIATNVHTKEETTFGKMGEQAWSFHGVLELSTGPPYVTPHDLMVTDIVLAFTNPSTAVNIVEVTIADRVVSCTIPINQTHAVTPANISIHQSSQICPSITYVGGSTDHDLTVICRFGRPVFI